MVVFCGACRAMRVLLRPKPITLNNGKSATEGTCGTCGARLVRPD
jgi:hypothetical protein